MKLALLGLAAAVGCAVHAAEPELPAGAAAAEQRINRDALAGAIRFLADDLLEGRAPAARGDRLARAYIRAEMEQLGLRPGGPGDQWEQPFAMVGLTTRAPKTWPFRAGERTLDLSLWDDFILASGVQAERARLDGAELVFVGYGITAPEFGWDDFKGRDLRGKLLLMLNNDPDESPELFAGKRRLYYGRWDYKYESAAKQGAAGAIILHTPESAGYPWAVVQNSWSGEQFELPDEGGPRLQLTGWVTEQAGRRLVALGGQDLDRLVAAAHRRDFQPVDLGVRTSVDVACELRRVETANVLGVLPGVAGPLAEQLVVFSAHHDHLGVGPPDERGDSIYNGALDNASGVAQLLAVARAFVALPAAPSRSVLFLALAAEEQGLLGSEYYARHPTVPAGRIAADINFDGGNIWGPTTDIALIGRGKSDLDRLAEAAAARQGRHVTDEAFPDRGFFYRSDQFNFAKIGVPSLYFDQGAQFTGRPADWGREQVETWENRHYHRPSDEFGPDWNLDGMVDDARLAFIAGLLAATQRELPAWRPGDEFEAARKRALSAP
ncbi:MAG TPA: M28 family peptidase [Candidatus Polarisedimenticolaceae bacterium]|nr:M28 family peptidase [Candidatus Polarisedimenticolaceae bacterium]